MTFPLSTWSLQSSTHIIRHNIWSSRNSLLPSLPRLLRRGYLVSISPTYARFICTKVSRQAFLYLHVRFELFLVQEYWRKCACKMLVKLTTVPPRGTRCYRSTSVINLLNCFRHYVHDWGSFMSSWNKRNPLHTSALAGTSLSLSLTLSRYHFSVSENVGWKFVDRFPSLFAVDTFYYFGPRILNSQIKILFLTEKWRFRPFFVCDWAINSQIKSLRITRAACIAAQ